MKLLGTVAHSRGTVVRLSWRMVPKPQLQTQRTSVKLLHGSRVLGWAQLRQICSVAQGGIT